MKEISDFNIARTKLVKRCINRIEHFELEIEGLNESRPSLIRGDKVLAKNVINMS